ncbi:hypothetical protein GMRT_11274 [Giardia muris]|uniref:HECT domain-containing protein n=1 Tax=Giardia muris TaxID=5742 RepID=A0A4Z1SUX0_GIAMU|nr:hypothetical protein GMRT_11274 [Giardia muris]|eukprot:TNJ27398.1 hypothetical protein GMRT_11274 [Giardia muris]
MSCSDGLATGEDSIVVVCGDGRVVEHAGTYPFGPRRQLLLNTRNESATLIDVRNLEAPYLFYAIPATDERTTIEAVRSERTKDVHVYICTRISPHRLGISIGGRTLMLTALKDEGQDTTVAVHALNLDTLLNPAGSRHVYRDFFEGAMLLLTFQDESICDVLATESFSAILTQSAVHYYSARYPQGLILSVPEVDEISVGRKHEVFAGRQHPLLQAHRLFFVGRHLILMTAHHLYLLVLSGEDSEPEVIAKFGCRLLTYTYGSDSLLICLANFTVYCLDLSADGDLRCTSYSFETDFELHCFSLDQDFLMEATSKALTEPFTRLSSNWPEIANPLKGQVDKVMNSIISKKAAVTGSAGMFQTFPSYPSYSPIRIFAFPNPAVDNTMIVALVYLNAPSAFESFHLLGSFIHEKTMDGWCTTVAKENVEHVSATFTPQTIDAALGSKSVRTPETVCTSLLTVLKVSPSTFEQTPHIFYLHMLLSLNAAIILAFGNFLVTRSSCGNLDLTRRSNMTLIYELLTLRDDLLQHLDQSHRDYVESGQDAPLALAAFAAQDLVGLRTCLYGGSDGYAYHIAHPSVTSGEHLLFFFSKAFKEGLSNEALGRALNLPRSPRDYTNLFITIDRISPEDYLELFGRNLFIAEFRMVMWALLSRIRMSDGGSCHSRPCLSDSYVYSEERSNELRQNDLKLKIIPYQAEVPHESLFEASMGVSHPIFSNALNFSAPMYTFHSYDRNNVSRLLDCMKELSENPLYQRSFYWPERYAVVQRAQSKSEGNGEDENLHAAFKPVSNKKNDATYKICYKYRVGMTLREFIRRFTPNFDVLLSVLSTLFNNLLELVNRTGSMSRSYLRLITLDTVVIDFAGDDRWLYNGFTAKDLEQLVFQLRTPFRSLGLDGNCLAPLTGVSPPPLLTDVASVHPSSYLSILFTSLVSQVFFEYLSLHSNGLMCLDHIIHSALGTPVPNSLIHEDMYSLRDMRDFFKTAGFSKLVIDLTANNIFVSLHVLANINICSLARGLYGSFSRMSGHQHSVLEVLRIYDIFCHVAAGITENATDIPIIIMYLRERHGSLAQYYSMFFGPELGFLESGANDYASFCAEKVPSFIRHLFAHTPPREDLLIVESLLYSNQDLRNRQQIIDTYRNDPVYKKYESNPNHPVVKLKDALLSMRLHRKHRMPSTVHQKTVLKDLLEACVKATPTAHTVSLTFENDPGIDGGGIFRSMISQCFQELLQGEKINDIPILATADDKLVPLFQGFIPISSAEVLPRLSAKRSAIYYLGRLVAFAMVFNVKFPSVFDDRLLRSLIGGRLYLDAEVMKKYEREAREDKMFTINGTPVDLLIPLSSEDYRRLYKGHDDLFLHAIDMMVAEGIKLKKLNPKAFRGGDVNTKVRELKVAPDYPIDGIIDTLAIPDWVIQTRKLSNSKDSILRWVIAGINGIRSGEAFKKTLSEFRNGFRQPFGTTMCAQIDERIKETCRMIDVALSEISLEDFKDMFLAEMRIDQKRLARALVPHLTSDPLEHFQTVVNRGRRNARQEVEHVTSLLRDVIKTKMPHQELSDFLFTATGSRYIPTDNIHIKVHSDGPFVIFHTCNNLVELPYNLQSVDELYKILRFSIYEALKGGFGLV